MTLGEAKAPDAALIEEIALSVRDALPELFKGAAKDVVLRVYDFADPQMLARLEIDNPFELTGLYDGVPLTQKSVSDQPEQPDVIWLFRRPILDEWAERGDVTLAALVGHIYVHELAHHFGWSDEDIAAIDPWWM